MTNLFFSLLFIIWNTDLSAQIITSTPPPNLEFLWNCKRNPDMGGDQCEAAIFFFCQGRCTRLNCAILSNRSVCIDVCGVENPQIQPCVLAGKRDPRFLSKPAVLNTGGMYPPGYDPSMMAMGGLLGSGIAALAGGIGVAAGAIGKGVTGAANAVGSGVTGAANAVGNGVTGAANAVGSGVTSAAGIVGSGVTGAAGVVGSGATGAAGTVGSGATGAASKASSGATSTASKASSGAKSTTSKAKKAL